MIITKQWLNEWIEVKDISTQKLCEVFNSIGLEVDSVVEHKMPKGVVVGLVKEKNPHPDADKLSVCMVDVGEETHQIVCGAKNVQKDQYIPVALNGATLPNGLTIKPTTLRGVESNGMICSSTELGLPKINDGIMVLDESLGELELGQELSQIPTLNDDVIDLELTANRGDCLSIHGVARDLSVSLQRDLKDLPTMEEDENLLGIGRILSIHVEDKIDSSFIYKALQYESAKDNVLIKIRLAMVEFDCKNPIECLINYVTYSTGVLLRAYDFECFEKDEKAEIYIKKSKEGFDGIFGNEKPISRVGYSQEKPCTTTDEPSKIIIEASYVKPEVISRLGMEHKNIPSDFHYYRSSRGSEPDLEFGIKYLDILLDTEDGVTLYGGMQKSICELEEKVINFEIDKAIGLIGQDIPKNQVVQILQGLGFGVMVKAEQDIMNIKVPSYRHDVSDMQDICEEIVRLIGIDNIASKPYVFAELSRVNKSYLDFKKRYDLRYKSVATGFFESIHYVFDDRKRMEDLGITAIYKKRDVANPISNELNTLRTTLALHLLDAVSLNVKNSFQSVSLFEIGKVFNQKREESTKIAWIMSGEVESPSLENHGKPKNVTLAKFASKISQIVGEFSLEKGEFKSKLFSSYEYANVMIKDVCVGYMARIHAKLEDELGIGNTYFCELDFDKLPTGRKSAKPYSKFPTSSRELSLLVPHDMPYKKVRECIEAVDAKKLVKFFPVDRFESKELGDNVSLSIKFIFQDENGTLEDEQVNKMISSILEKLNKKLNITLR